MISDEKKCIFVHIPKTGGTSVENLIWGRDLKARSSAQLWMGIVRPGFNKYQSGGLQHLLATQIRTEVGRERFSRYYKFAFVRNPWDKVVSQYAYVLTRPMICRYMGLSRFSSFAQYVRTIGERHGRHVQSFEQWRFILDDDGRQLVDFVGRFERLQADFEAVAAELGLPDARLPHERKSARKPYRAYYNDETAALVARTYARDIELFGYSF